MDQPAPPLPARGYFAIGAERISKALNLGNLMRSAHGFGASFTFTIGASYAAWKRAQIPPRAASICRTTTGEASPSSALPEGCRLVGVELARSGHRAAKLSPSVARGLCAVGPERGSLSPELVARCDYLVRIPRHFCINPGDGGRSSLMY